LLVLFEVFLLVSAVLPSTKIVGSGGGGRFLKNLRRRDRLADIFIFVGGGALF